MDFTGKCELITGGRLFGAIILLHKFPERANNSNPTRDKCVRRYAGFGTRVEIGSAFSGGRRHG